MPDHNSTPVDEYGCASVYCYGCEGYAHRQHSSQPGWTTSFGVYTDLRTGRTFCADCALMLLSWIDDDMPETENPDLSFPDWLDMPRVCWEAS